MAVSETRLSVALSDALLGATHEYAARRLWREGATATQLSTFGFATVSAAAFIGTARWGAAPGMLQKAHSNFTELAGFVGLPLIAAPALRKAIGGTYSDATYLFFLLITYNGIRSLDIKKRTREHVKTGINVALTVAPLAMLAPSDSKLLLGLGLYFVGGAVVGADTERWLGPVRRADVFHVVLAVGGWLIADALATHFPV